MFLFTVFSTRVVGADESSLCLYGLWTFIVGSFISLFNGIPKLLVHGFIFGVHEFVVNRVQ